MPRDWQLRIEDILEAISRIQRYLEGMDQAGFIGDERTMDAVVRNFGIIGEAVIHLPEQVRMLHPELPWSRMRGLRNLVIHEYFGVSPEILWSTAKEDLPPLVGLLRALLEGDSLT
jgi:uncharacterized protein with HEPN domain